MRGHQSWPKWRLSWENHRTKWLDFPCPASIGWYNQLGEVDRMWDVQDIVMNSRLSFERFVQKSRPAYPACLSTSVPFHPQLED